MTERTACISEADMRRALGHNFDTPWHMAVTEEAVFKCADGTRVSMAQLIAKRGLQLAQRRTLGRAEELVRLRMKEKDWRTPTLVPLDPSDTV